MRDSTRNVVAKCAGVGGVLLLAGAAVVAARPAFHPLAGVLFATIGGAAITFAMMAALGAARHRRACHADLQRAVAERTSRLTESNAQIQQALADAESADRAKSNFLMNMSHELRTPLTAILGYADLLTAPDLPLHERAEFVQQIRRSGRHLLTLINDVLDISRIESGELIVNSRSMNPCQIFEEVVSLARPQLGRKPIRLETDIQLPIPETIHADPDRLRQILMSLLGNALKFTESGVVTLRMSFKDGGSPLVRFEVTDTGPGIEPARLENLFKPFSQHDTSATRRYAGVGTGLSLSRRLIDLLGGTLEVSSEVGRGSTFVVTVPTGSLAGVAMRDRVRKSDLSDFPGDDPSDDAARRARLTDETPLAGRRILFVEDGPDNRRLVCFHLTRAGAYVETADDGRQGHDVALAAAKSGRPFDLIFMDMQMPDMDGYTATTLLRSHGYDGPIVALTAHAMSGDRERCLTAGCDDYLTKPIDRSGLIVTAQRWVLGAGRHSQESRSASSGPTKGG